MESTVPTHPGPQGTTLSGNYSVLRTGSQRTASARLTNYAKSVKLSAYQGLPSAYQSLPSTRQSLPSAYLSLPSTHQNLPSAYQSLPSAYQYLISAEPRLPRDYLVEGTTPPALGGWEDFQDLSVYCETKNSQFSAMDKFAEGSTSHIADELNTPDVVEAIDKFNFNHTVFGEDIPMVLEDDWALAPLAPFPLDIEICPLDGVLGGSNTDDGLVFGGTTTKGELEKEPQHMVETIRFSEDEWGLHLDSEQVVSGDYIIDRSALTLLECSDANMQREQLLDIQIEQFINANPVENEMASLNQQGNGVNGKVVYGTVASVDHASTTENKGTSQNGKQMIRISSQKVKNIGAAKSKGSKRLRKGTTAKKSQVNKGRQMTKPKVIKTEPMEVEMQPVVMDFDPGQKILLAEDIAVGSEQEINSTEIKQEAAPSGTTCDLSSLLEFEMDVGEQVGQTGPGLRLDFPKLPDILHLGVGDYISTPEVSKTLEADPEFDLLAYVFDNNKTKLSLDTPEVTSILGSEVMFPMETLETDNQVLRVVPITQPKPVKLVGAQTSVPPAATPVLPLINVNIIGTGVKNVIDYHGKRRAPVLSPCLEKSRKPISGEEDDGDDEEELRPVTAPTASAKISTLLLNAAKSSSNSISPSTSRTSTSCSPPAATRSSDRKRDQKKNPDYEWYEAATDEPRNAEKPPVVQSSSDESSSTSSKRPCPSSTEETVPLCYRYRQLRSKNNEASRKSRLNRKMRDRELNEQANIMTRNNVKLKLKAEELERLVKRMREALLQAVLGAKKS